MCQLKLELSCIAPVMVYGYGASCLDSSQLWAHVCCMKAFHGWTLLDFMTCVSTRIHGLYIQNVNVNGVRYVLLPLAESGIEHASTLWEWGNRAHFFQSLRTTLACPISVFDL